MMKKAAVLLALLLSVLPAVSGQAYDSWFEVGRSIGTAIGNSMTPSGSDDKNFYCDEYYDFSKIKYLVIDASLPQNTSFISDPYIAKKYPEILKEKFGDKFKVKTAQEAVQEYYKYWYPIHPEYTAEQHVQEMMRRITEEGGVLVHAVVAAYSQGAYGTGNCWVIFDVQPYGSDVVLSYSDMRMNAPRSSKEGMIKRISGKFVSKFMDVYEKSLNKEK